MSKTTKCQGCGAEMQTTEKDKVGFALSLSHDYCQACYKLMHYGESETHFHPEDLPKLPENALIFMVSSVLHLDLLFSYPVYRYQPQAHYVYIINQIDLLPASTNLDILIENMTKKAKALNIPFVDIILMSAKNPHDLEHLKAYIDHFKSKDIYLLGVQNSGKTTIFKALTKHPKALAFKKAGLTQEALVGIYKDKTIYDMPGLYQEGYLHQFLPYQIYKRLIPDQMLKPKVYQLKSNQALCLEGLIAISFLNKDTNPVLYVDDQMHVHKTNHARIKPLFLEKEKHFKVFVETYEEKAIKIPQGKQQITFSDMGFMHIEGPMTIKIVLPKGMHISISEALFQ